MKKWKIQADFAWVVSIPTNRALFGTDRSEWLPFEPYHGVLLSTPTFGPDAALLIEYGDITILSVSMTDEPGLKPVIWVGSSREDLRAFPEPVQDHIGYAVYVAQRGGKHRNTKTLSGFGGAGVVEVVKDFRGDTFRAVYTLRYAGTVYVLPPSRRNRRPDAKRRAGTCNLLSNG